MKLRDILNLLEGDCVIALRNEGNLNAVCPDPNTLICMTMSNSEGVDPYLDRELKSWGLTSKTNHDTIADLVIVLKNKTVEPENILYNGADH